MKKEKEKLKEQIKFKLEMLEICGDIFQSLCHSKKCSDISECPAEHPDCKRKLGLHTSIAWQASQEIFSFLWENIFKDLDHSIEMAKIHRVIFSTLVEIVLRHKNKHSKLLERLKESETLLASIEYLLNKLKIENEIEKNSKKKGGENDGK